jgi:translation initiation factor 3 subunit M
LKLLCNFYNLLKSGTAERFQVLLVIIEYARDTKQVIEEEKWRFLLKCGHVKCFFLDLELRSVLIIHLSSRRLSLKLDILSEFFADLENWKKNWRHLSAEDERRLYLLVSETLAGSGKVAEAQLFLIKYLATFRETDPGLDTPVTVALAVKGVIGAVREPLNALRSASDLLSLPAVKRLASDPAHKAVHELLEIFCFGKLADLTEYEDRNPGVLEANGVGREKALRDMRLLSLSLLAAEYEEIPYEAISATLQVPHEDVESWIVEAITARLLEAKMDQEQEVVMVTRASHRHFSPQNWLRLQEKLHIWRQNVSSLLVSLREKKGARTQASRVQESQQYVRSSHSN